MHTLKRLSMLAALLLALAVPLSAQTTLNSTTLAAAMTATQESIILTSAASVAVGDVVYIEGSVMIAQTVNTTTGRVGISRHSGKTAGHTILATVYTGVPARFYSYDVSGACTSTNEQFLPHINTVSGKIFDCKATTGIWIDLDKLIIVTCNTGPLVTGSIDQTCFTADRRYVIYKIYEIHTVAEAGGTLTLILRRQQSTEAPASGDALTAAAIDMVAATAQTLKTPALSATAAYLFLEVGNRLGLDFTDDAAGELIGVTVTFVLYPLL
jgi:hypothetical protein